MTDKKLCGLRSVPSLFRLFANGVHAAPQEWRRDYKETALLYGRVVSRCTLSVNARSPLARSPLARSSRSARLPPPFARSARSRQRLCLPWLRYARPPWGVRPPLAVTLAPLVRFSVSLRKEKRYFREKRAFGGTHIFPENGMFGFFSVSTPKKHESKQILYITRSYVTFFVPPPLATGNVT